MRRRARRRRTARDHRVRCDRRRRRAVRVPDREHRATRPCRFGVHSDHDLGSRCDRVAGATTAEPMRGEEGSDPMWRTIKRWWRYLSVKARRNHKRTAAPKVQLEQALLDAREQHARLTDQAASVVANQKSAQARLDQAVDEYERVKTQAGHALRTAP